MRGFLSTLVLMDLLLGPCLRAPGLHLFCTWQVHVGIRNLSLEEIQAGVRRCSSRAHRVLCRLPNKANSTLKTHKRVVLNFKTSPWWVFNKNQDQYQHSRVNYGHISNIGPPTFLNSEQPDVSDLPYRGVYSSQALTPSEAQIHCSVRMP